MTSVSIQARCKSVWEDVATKVNKAVVFMDNVSAENLHWIGGAMFLIQAGALNIKEFSSFESGEPSDRKAVFIISGPLSGTNSDIMCDILQASNFQYVIVISSLCPAMHTVVWVGSGDNDMRAFEHMEEQILEWMGNMNYTVEMLYKPLVCTPITPNLFVIPEHSQFFPLLPSEIEQLQKLNKKPQQSLDDYILDFAQLPREAQLQTKLLVCSLNAMLEQLNVAEDLYCLGSMSRVVISELASLHWAKSRRKSAQTKASLLVLDRTLDLASCTGHHTETLLDKVLSLLPRLHGHNNDVRVNMAPLCSVTSGGETIVPGCLAHPADNTATSLLASITTSKYKEGLMEVNRQIVEAASHYGLPLKLTGKPGRVNADSLNSTLSLFKGKSNALRRCSGLVQITQAVIETLRNPGGSTHDSLLGVEKGFLQCLDDPDSTPILSQLTQTINKEMEKSVQERLYDMTDVFILLIYLYSLMDPMDIQDEQKERILQSAIVSAIMKQSSETLPEFLHTLVGKEKNEERLLLIMEDLFERLRGLTRVRENMKQLHTIYEEGGITSVASLKPLLKQITEEIFNPNKPDMPDIEYKSTGFRDLLKSGFGLFMNVGKPRPGDNPLLILFVIGGVTPTEVRQIKEAVTASKSNVQVVVGSTKMIKPQDLLNSIFVQDNLHPKNL